MPRITPALVTAAARGGGFTVEGADLEGPLAEAIVVNYAHQIAAGLDAAHEKGIVTP